MSRPARAAPSIWWWAFGYFATYVPYVAMINAITVVGLHGRKIDGVAVLPATVCATVVTAITFLFATGWWRHAVKPGHTLPTPTPATIASGLCSSGIIVTTSYAYTFHGIVLVSLMMRGGVLIIAPLIDLLTGRRIRWYSATALVLAIAALSLPLLSGTGDPIPLACGIDVAIYISCYFVRLQLMTRRAKSPDEDANLRYFVEEQLVSAPALLAGLFVFALVGPGFFAEGLHAGFFDFWSAEPLWFIGVALLVGMFSQGTGIFGGLILLDRSENTFSVPVNRASSVLAGLVGAFVLEGWLDARAPKTEEVVGALIMIAAISVLSVGSLRDKKKRAA